MDNNHIDIHFFRGYLTIDDGVYVVKYKMACDKPMTPGDAYTINTAKVNCKDCIDKLMRLGRNVWMEN